MGDTKNSKHPILHILLFSPALVCHSGRADEVSASLGSHRICQQRQAEVVQFDVVAVFPIFTWAEASLKLGKFVSKYSRCSFSVLLGLANAIKV